MPDDPYLPMPSASPAPGSALPPGWPTNPSWWARLGRWRRLGIGAAVVMLVLALAWPLIDHPARVLAAGTIYNTGYAAPTDHHATVRLPWGRLYVSTSDPRDSLPHDVAEYDAGGSVQPPDGGHFVAVRWRADNEYDSTSFRLARAGQYRTLVSLVTGGKSFPLDPGDEHAGCAVLMVCVGPYGSNKAWLAVPGSGSDVTIAVSYDGVTQTVDMANGRVDPGRAAGLYSADASRPASGTLVLDAPPCGTPTWSAGFSGDHATCTAQTGRTPYVPGLGWASPGHTWVTLEVNTDRPYSVSYHRGGTQRVYAAAFVKTVRYSIDGGRLAAREASGTASGDLSVGRTLYPGEMVVFAVPTADHQPISIRSTWGLDPENASRPPSATTADVTATWTVQQ